MRQPHPVNTMFVQKGWDMKGVCMCEAIEGIKNNAVLETLVGLIKKGLLTVAQAAEEAHMTVPEFEEKTGLKA